MDQKKSVHGQAQRPLGCSNAFEWIFKFFQADDLQGHGVNDAWLSCFAQPGFMVAEEF